MSLAGLGVDAHAADPRGGTRRPWFADSGGRIARRAALWFGTLVDLGEEEPMEVAPRTWDAAVKPSE